MDELESRFWSKVDKNGRTMPGMDTCCWDWTASSWSGGQGVFSIGGGKIQGAHRWIWEKTHGPLQKGQFVCHHCENLKCVRPEHLYLGGQKEAHRKSGRTGDANSMYGKQHSPTTKQKMSRSRTGKTGSKATAWKGGLTPLNRKIRMWIHRRLNWYGRVFQRDYWTCQACGVKKGKIDAHHIKPLAGIIRRLLTGKNFPTEDALLEWLIQQPEIADPNLTNGITLCRRCHKDAHNWGSHNP